MARIIVNGDMTHFSTQQYIDPERWDAKAGRSLGKTTEERSLNALLAQIGAAAQRHYFDLQASGDSISALKIKNLMCSTEEKPCTPAIYASAPSTDSPELRTTRPPMSR